MTALAALESRLSALVRQYMAPPPKLTVSEWADRTRMVSSYSAEPGPWRTARTPYLREIMDAASDPEVNTVVFMKCARIGGTEAGLNIVGYFIDQDPSPIMIVQPRVDDAKDFSKEQLAPMLADTEPLARKVRAPNSRDSGNTVQAKVFDGGALFLVGANSPGGFRRRTARVLILEEADGYPASAGAEGDPMKLAMRRTSTFAYRRKVYINSTPTLKGLSRIEDYYERSDQRRYHVPCPHCGHMAPLRWGTTETAYGMRWKDIPEPQYLCEGCGALWGEAEKFPALAAGMWVADRPGRPIRGYHLNALYSPWVTWRELVDEWTEAQGDVLKLQVFVNTVLGETWEDRRGGLDSGALALRPKHKAGTVPYGVQVLTMGVDVQDDRLEATVWGWGAGRQRWRIAHDVLRGDPEKPEVWALLEALRVKHWACEDGQARRVFATGVDSGAHTQAVYAWCGPRYAERVYAVKGSSTAGAPLLPRGPTRAKGCRVFVVGTETAKDEWYGALRTGAPGPMYVAFDEGLDAGYLQQLTAERAVRKQVNGRWVRRYELPRGERSEALDCAVYALVALMLTGVRLKDADPATAPAPPPAVPLAPEPATMPATEVIPAPPPSRNLGAELALARLRRGWRR